MTEQTLFSKILMRDSRPSVQFKELLHQLAGRHVFDLDRYRESELTRLMNLFAHADIEQWREKKILEVGAGLGRIGDVFADLGFEIVSTDNRVEYVEEIRRRGRNAFVLDLDTTSVEDAGDFDVILAFGVLYHLANPRMFLDGCGAAAEVLLLETVVCDNADPVLHTVRERTGWFGRDQASNGLGSRPSRAWVEQVCREAGFDSVLDISSPIANWSTGVFDWVACNDNEWRRGAANLRSMWVCTKSSL